MAQIDRVLLCTCEDSQSVDVKTAAAALGGADVIEARALCSDEAGRAVEAFGADGATLVACGQMAQLFRDLFDDVEAPGELLTVDIRGRARLVPAGAVTDIHGQKLTWRFNVVE